MHRLGVLGFWGFGVLGRVKSINRIRRGKLKVVLVVGVGGN